MRVSIARHRLHFKQPSRTSREVLNHKDVWYVKLTDPSTNRTGVGECAVFPGLSCDWTPEYEQRLIEICQAIKNGDNPEIESYPSIKFGIESAMTQIGGEHQGWTSGDVSFTINGLVWMGSEEEMTKRVEEKIAQGFGCVKLKIGGIDFDRELAILRSVRKSFSKNTIEIRLDANGAFTPENALKRLDQLARFDIHSIEQPIRQHQWTQMRTVCAESPIPIALDEELIGINSGDAKARMLDAIQPAYIILKPTLCGGLSGSDEWITLATERNIGWWATSALESNVGLNAIANWLAGYNPSLPQGLGTGALYTNNIPSPLQLRGEKLSRNPMATWDLSILKWTEL